MRTRQSKLPAAALVALVTVVAVCGGWSVAHSQTPSSLVTEHTHLREDLARAAADPGGVGDAAKAVERILTPHLQHQEQVVLSPLGLIRGLVDGEPPADSTRVLEITDQINRELPKLLQEHRAILDATQRFSDAARREGKTQYLRLADRIRTYVLLEDQVLYPAALLVGRSLKSGVSHHPATGSELFRTYCASCHGASGRGNGAVALFLRVPPADLTQIAARNKGVFPADRVYEIIDRRQSVKLHGDSQMPVWGDAFSRSVAGGDERVVKARIQELVAYLKTLQAPASVK